MYRDYHYWRYDNQKAYSEGRMEEKVVGGFVGEEEEEEEGHEGESKSYLCLCGL